MERKRRYSKGEGSISKITKNIKRKDGTITRKTYWQGYVTIGFDPKTNKQIKEPFSATSETEARAKRDAVLDKLKKKVNILETKDKTVTEYIYEYLEYFLTDIRKNTQNDYNRYYRVHIQNSSLANVLVDKMDTRHFQIFIKELEKKGICPATIHNVFKPIKRAFAYAKANNYIAINPIAEVKLPRIEQKDVIIFTKEEVEKIKKEAKNNHYYLAFRVLFFGLRVSELLAIRWQNVNFEDNTIYIDKQIYFEKGKGVSLENPKTDNAIRFIPISTEVMELLAKSKEEYETKKAKDKNFNKLGLVFINNNNNPIRQNNFRAVFNTMLKKLGIEHHKVHSSRHTFCTYALEHMSVKDVAEYVGHANISTTSRYLHGSLKQKAIGIQAMGL